MTCSAPALIVDDDPAVARLLAAFLDRIGLAVTVVHDRVAAEAQLASSTLFRLLVTDLELHGQAPGEGLALLSRCGELQPGCKRILVSGSVGPEVAELVRTHGGDLFMSKPLTFAQLSDAVRALLAV